MSANLTTETKPTRQPTLAAKYAKFIHFAFHLVEKMVAENPDIDGDVLRKSAHIFDNTSVQTGFVEDFMTKSKDISKQIKDIVSQKKKDAIKAEKEAIKAEKIAERQAARDLIKAKKSKRSKTANIEDDLVSDLVSLAINNEPVDQLPQAEQLPEVPPVPPVEDTNHDEKKTAKEAKEAEKKEAKEAEKKAAKEAKEAEKKAAKEAKEAEKKAAKEAKEAEKKAAKEAKDAEKKTTTTTTTTAAKESKGAEVDTQTRSIPGDHSNMLEVELDVSMFKFQDTSYLIDANSQLYDFQTHHHIGHYDKFLNRVVRL